MRRGWLRRNRLPEPSGTSIRAGGFSACPSASVSSPFLWWSLGAEALGIKTRRSPGGRSKFFAFCWGGIPGAAYTGKYPIPLDGNSAVSDRRLADVGRQQAAKLDGKQRENLKGK